MGRKRTEIWTTKGDSDEDAETIIKSFFKSDFCINKKPKIDKVEVIEQEKSIESDNESFLGRKQFRDEEEENIGPRPGVDFDNRMTVRGDVTRPIEEVERYESLGYVMSGSRHKKNNIPIAKNKKDAQSFTAEEKRALAVYNLEEQQRRENNIINQMKSIWKSKKEEK
jgi:hypothetical protein